MSRDIHVHLLPDLFAPEALRGGIAIVIDVLRASTTIIHALASGAAAVYPCASVGDARRLAQRLGRDVGPVGPTGPKVDPASAPGDVGRIANPSYRPSPARQTGRTVLLGGERLGVTIEGFDLDNSPASYSPERVAGCTIVFTTTNGTRAIERSRKADRILIGAFANRAAIVEALAADHRPVHFVCAGTDGQVTADDVLAAGMLAASLAERLGDDATLDEEACVAAAFHAAHADDAARLNVLRGSRGGRNLIALGFDADIEQSARYDTCDVAPEYDPLAGALQDSRQTAVGSRQL
ncbi:MAG: 2-phosphosulfolactate phosphatase [Planctomycetales bacterium]